MMEFFLFSFFFLPDSYCAPSVFWGKKVVTWELTGGKVKEEALFPGISSVGFGLRRRWVCFLEMFSVISEHFALRRVLRNAAREGLLNT